MKFIWTDTTYEIATGLEEVIYKSEMPFGTQPRGVIHNQQRPSYCIVYLHELNNSTPHPHDVQDYLHTLMMATIRHQIRVEKD